MTKIIYECDDNSVGKIELNGSGGELIKGVCRIIAGLKRECPKIKDADFEEMIKKGVKVAELEHMTSKKDDDDVCKKIDKMLDLMTELLK